MRSFLLLISLCSCLSSAEYFIDYSSGNDSLSGLSAEQAWQHAPGDSEAKENAKACQLKPGDSVRLKGGVRYFGSISLNKDGSKESPIIIDGNLDGDYGTGPAIIDGSIPLDNWTACKNAEEADGNPNWAQIHYVDILSSAPWNLINIHNLEQSYPVAQEPNMPDPHYQEMATYFLPSKNSVREEHAFTIKAIDMKTNSTRPLVSMFDNSRDSAVIDNLNGGKVSVQLAEPQTIVNFGLVPQPNYSNPSKIRVFIDGNEVALLEPTVSGNKAEEQLFQLETATTGKEILFSFEGAHPDKDGSVRNWGAIAKLAAYDMLGNNVLYTERKSFYQNSDFFTQTDPHYWDGACLSFYVQPAMVRYQPIRSYDPEKHEVSIDLLTAAQYANGGSFSVLNTLKVLDRAGEYVVKNLGENKRRIYFWPQHSLENIRYSKHELGISIASSHVTVRGIHTRGQGGNKSGCGISVYKRGGEGIHIQGCDIALCRGYAPALSITGTSHSLVEDCYIHDNALHTKGTVARLLEYMTYRNCTFERNTSTAFDYYTVSNGAILDCLIRDNQGMHANGITFYVGCSNIIVDGNEVYDGNVGITFQDGNNIIIRNNIIESKHAFGIGVWDGKAYDNILICNNIIRGNRLSGSAKGAIFGGNPNTKGLGIYNNIIDGGFDGNILNKAHFDHNVFVDLGNMSDVDIVENNFRIPDINHIFVDAENRDYRLAKDSPVIGKGISLGNINPVDKSNQAWVGSPNIGPYQASSPRAFSTQRSVEEFSVGDFAFKQPSIEAVNFSKANFVHLSSDPTCIIKAGTFSGQANGTLRIKPDALSIYGWDDIDHWVEWDIEVAEAGTYELCLNQTTATVAKRSFSINGEDIENLQQVDMSYTGSWKKWTDHYLPQAIPLHAGKNKLRITAAGGSLNVMELRVYRIKD